MRVHTIEADEHSAVFCVRGHAFCEGSGVAYMCRSHWGVVWVDASFIISLLYASSRRVHKPTQRNILHLHAQAYTLTQPYMVMLK